MKKQLIGLILPFFMCALTPLKATADLSTRVSFSGRITIVTVFQNGHPVDGAEVTFYISGVAEDDGTVSLDTITLTTDSYGRVQLDMTPYVSSFDGDVETTFSVDNGSVGQEDKQQEEKKDDKKQENQQQENQQQEEKKDDKKQENQQQENQQQEEKKDDKKQENQQQENQQQEEKKDDKKQENQQQPRGQSPEKTNSGTTEEETLSSTSVTTDTNSQATTTLVPGSDLGSDTVEEFESVIFSATAIEQTSDSQEAPESDPLLASIDDVTSAAEHGRMTFTVRLEPTPTAPTAVKYATASRTAIAGVDYEAASGTLDFEAGQSTATFIVWIRRDEQDEPDESFGVRIVHPSTGVLLAEATGTITDDDGTTPPEADSDGDDERAFGFAEQVADQAYTTETAITTLVLPEATGGEGVITYRVSELPAGLLFDAATRTISGTPAAATDGAIEVTYTAEDSAGVAATLTFSIAVNPPLSFGDLLDLFGAGGG